MGFFGTLINGYKIMGQETGAYVQKNRAQIASGVSIIGTLVSNILSTKAGAKSARAIDAKASEIGRPLTTKEKVVLCWKNHIVPGAVMSGSMVSAQISNNIHVQNFNKAATAYGAMKRLYDSTQKATKEVLGEKKAAELQDKINQKYIEESPEIKKKILDTPNPDPSTMRKFWEKKTGEVIVTTVDKMKLAFKVMQAEMDALKPRDASNSALNGCYGVHLLRLFDLVDHEVPKAKRMSDDIRFAGFNKGKEENGSDDQIIDTYFTPMILDDKTMETCLAINWEDDPCDMRYGDYLKS